LEVIPAKAKFNAFGYRRQRFSFQRGMIEMYQGLRYLGKDVTLLRYEGEAHGFKGPAMADFWKRENEFFDRYLNPEARRN
jgi:dipeptidyl aminopeptidase/acylaminoacyl peptidase